MGIAVELSNLGPLRSASIDLTDLTLLIGDNNTGKTFAATVIHRVLGADRPGAWYSRLEARAPDGLLQQVAEVLDEPGEGRASCEESRFELDEESLQWVRRAAQQALEAYGESVRDSITYAYGTESRRLRRRTASRHASDCFLRIDNPEPRWQLEIRFDSDQVRANPPDPNDLLNFERVRSLADGRGVPSPYPGGSRADRHRLVRFMPRWVNDALFDGWPDRAVHLPADRTGIMQSHNMLAGATARQAARAGLRPVRVDTLPGTSADFLSLVLEMPERLQYFGRGKSTFRAEVLRFEKDLRATIDLDHSTNGVDAIVANTAEGRFPMTRVSSMLSELAPLLLVLKAPGLHVDHLTIDEPEAHLHPEMQVRVASFLATLVERGLRVVLTTHSDFFVSQINNMMRRRELATNGNRSGDPSELGLEPSKVQALRFFRNNGWCTASELRPDRLDGVDESTFTDVMRAQYFETAELVNGLLESVAE